MHHAGSFQGAILGSLVENAIIHNSTRMIHSLYTFRWSCSTSVLGTLCLSNIRNHYALLGDTCAILRDTRDLGQVQYTVRGRCADLFTRGSDDDS